MELLKPTLKLGTFKKGDDPVLYNYNLVIDLEKMYKQIYDELTNIINTSFRTLDDTGTPSVKNTSHNISRWLTGGTTTITDFDDGYTGQIIIIVAEHTVTITDGTNIFLSGSANYVMGATDTLTLIQKSDGFWYELARSNN